MTLDEAVAVVRSIEIGYPFKAWGAQIVVIKRHDELRLTMWMDAPHRDTGEQGMGGVHTPMYLTAAALTHMRAQDLITRVRMLLKTQVLHEADEALLVGGRRVFDPHAHEEVAAYSRAEF